MARFEDSFWVANGFEELHKYMKTGSEFCKEFENILADRAELENQYVNGFHKIAKKAKKATKRCLGNTLEPAWQKFITCLETDEEHHRALATSLSQDCAKAMKAFTDTQNKTREPLEAAVEKQHKVYMDKHRSQLKNKRTAFKSCRDLEAGWDQLEDQRGVKTDKDIHKMEKSCRKLEETLVKTDREYRDSNLKTEESRLAWESAMYRCCRTMEVLEQERLQQLQSMLIKYTELIQTVITPTQDSCQELLTAADEISPDTEIDYICSTFGTGPNQPEQLLVDYYEEDLHNKMNEDRRRTNLEKKLQFLEKEIDRQEKAKTGVEQLAKVYQEQPDFVDEKGADDVSRELAEADSMLNLLKANHYKLLCTHAEICGQHRPDNEFENYVTKTTDKHNQPVSILKIPAEAVGSFQGDYERTDFVKQGTMKGSYSNGGASYGGGGADDEFDQSDEEQVQVGGSLDFDQDGYDYVGQCEVLYGYTAQQGDELTISPGDTVNIIEKYDEDWWQGELNGTVGIFPASYVQDL